jgi:hypothetical protein
LIDQSSLIVDRLHEFERALPRFAIAIAVADDVAISPQLHLSSTLSPG